MAQILVRDLDDDVKTRLQKRARRHGRSTEEEVRVILRNAVATDVEAAALGTAIARRFRGLGLEEDIPVVKGKARPARLRR